MNKAIITGRMVRDPEAKTTPSGAEFVKFCVAVNRPGKDAGADFINCTAFSKQAEFIGKYFIKGMKIDLTGHIQTGSYTNKDGQKVFTTDVIVETAEFGESRKAAAAEGVVADSQETRPERKVTEDDSFIYVDDEDDAGLPFA